VNIDVTGAIGIYQDDTFLKEEEKILISVPVEERPVELLTQWEMKLKALEDWLDSPEPGGGCHKIAMLEETHQHEEHLVDGAGTKLAEEMTGVSLSEVIAKQKPNDEETVGVEAAVKWQVKATRD
jgi:hypothetical protein